MENTVRAVEDIGDSVLDTGEDLADVVKDLVTLRPVKAARSTGRVVGDVGAAVVGTALLPVSILSDLFDW